MDDIGAFYRRFSPHSAIVTAFFCPFIRTPSFFIVLNSDTLRVINWLSGVYLFLYFDSGTFFAVHYGAGLKIYHIQVVVNLP